MINKYLWKTSNSVRNFFNLYNFNQRFTSKHILEYDLIGFLQIDINKLNSSNYEDLIQNRKIVFDFYLQLIAIIRNTPNISVLDIQSELNNIQRHFRSLNEDIESNLKIEYFEVIKKYSILLNIPISKLNTTTAQNENTLKFTIDLDNFIQEINTIDLHSLQILFAELLDLAQEVLLTQDKREEYLDVYLTAKAFECNPEEFFAYVDDFTYLGFIATPNSDRLNKVYTITKNKLSIPYKELILNDLKLLGLNEASKSTLSQLLKKINKIKISDLEALFNLVQIYSLLIKQETEVTLFNNGAQINLKSSNLENISILNDLVNEVILEELDDPGRFLEINEIIEEILHSEISNNQTILNDIFDDINHSIINIYTTLQEDIFYKNNFMSMFMFIFTLRKTFLIYFDIFHNDFTLLISLLENPDKIIRNYIEEINLKIKKLEEFLNAPTLVDKIKNKRHEYFIQVINGGVQFLRVMEDHEELIQQILTLANKYIDNKFFLDLDNIDMNKAHEVLLEIGKESYTKYIVLKDNEANHNETTDEELFGLRVLISILASLGFEIKVKTKTDIQFGLNKEVLAKYLNGYSLIESNLNNLIAFSLVY